MTQSSAPTTTTTLYVHDLDDHIIAEMNANGQTLKECIWLNDMPVAVVDGVNTPTPTIYYVHVDHLMRPIRMTDQNWNWVWDVTYSPFGATTYLYTHPEVMNGRFPGQWFQLETGLAYNWHRHYDPTLGRYIQPDPLGLRALRSDGPSAYAYAKSNPEEQFRNTQSQLRRVLLEAEAMGCHAYDPAAWYWASTVNAPSPDPRP